MSKENEKIDIDSTDILSNIRKIEARKKQVLIAKKINELKAFAKEINKLKAKSGFVLEEIGVSKEDIKRVIDFVNELEDVKLTEDEQKDLRTDAKKSVASERSGIEKGIEKYLSPQDELNQLMQSKGMGFKSAMNTTGYSFTNTSNTTPLIWEASKDDHPLTVNMSVDNNAQLVSGDKSLRFKV